MTGSHKRTRHVVEDDFLHIFRHFLGTFKKTGSYLVKRQKKERPRVHIIGTLSFFRGKSDVFEMRKTTKFHLVGPCQHEGPIW